MPLFIVMRCLQACGSSAVVAVGAGSLADMFEVHERGQKLGVFYGMPLVGPAIGPLIGGGLGSVSGSECGDETRLTVRHSDGARPFISSLPTLPWSVSSSSLSPTPGAENDPVSIRKQWKTPSSAPSTTTRPKTRSAPAKSVADYRQQPLRPRRQVSLVPLQAGGGAWWMCLLEVAPMLQWL